MKKKFRRSIRIGGKQVTETFATKSAADAWYAEQFDRKKAGKSGILLPRKDGVLFKTYALGEFMDVRRANYPASTWKSDLQRIEKYLLPSLGNLQIASIQSDRIRALLKKITIEFELSPNTRNRVRALISAIFNEALNRDAGPLVSSNPTFGLSFKSGKRVGEAEPSYLQTTHDCVAYLKAAGELSDLHLIVGCLGLMAGLRKQEMIGLRWGRVDFKNHSLEIAEKFVQAAGKITKGTKRGEQVVRYVPMGEELEEVLSRWSDKSKHVADEDFVLCNPDGSHLGPKQIYQLNKETCVKAKVSVTVHGLRHSFGREFAERSGNMGALKDILGHSNLMTTQRYSTLGKERLKGFRDVISYKK